MVMCSIHVTYCPTTDGERATDIPSPSYGDNFASSHMFYVFDGTGPCEVWPPNHSSK